MIQKGLTVGLLEVNCYILGDEETKEAVVIDPGGDEDEILDVLNHHKLQLKLIIDTHGHFDHVDANQPLKEATGAKSPSTKPTPRCWPNPRRRLCFLPATVCACPNRISC